MRLFVRALLTVLICFTIAFALVMGLASPRRSMNRYAGRAKGRQAAPAVEREKPVVFDVTRGAFEDGGFSAARSSMAPLRDPRSLEEMRNAVRSRGRRGIEALRAKYLALPTQSPPTPEQAREAFRLQKTLALLFLYQGELAEAESWIHRAMETASRPPFAADDRDELPALMGIIALRRGEIENCLDCLGPSSCIFPIAGEAVHKNPAGSRDAVRWLTAYLEKHPRDLRGIWLLNLAAMTLGDYPDAVPRAYRLPAGLFDTVAAGPRFENVAAAAGLTARGPNLAGGSVFDDFTGDGLPDLFTTSLDADLGASLYVNRGDGTFADRSAAAGLGGQTYALNAARADYDNDGDLDVLLLRGGWEMPLRLSLLRNRGDGTFDDVTLAAGMDEPIQTEAAAWGDFDDDGLVDVFVCGEYVAPAADPARAPHDDRNRCRLYRNLGNGRFADVAARAGVTNDRCSKGAAWGDYDGDGRLDLFASKMGQPCRLYHNEGDGTFRDVAAELGVTGPDVAFAPDLPRPRGRSGDRDHGRVRGDSAVSAWVSSCPTPGSRIILRPARPRRARAGAGRYRTAIPRGDRPS